ncbi:MAG TPA: cation:proton antiporter, partial [Longimicrobiales bacterium]
MTTVALLLGFSALFSRAVQRVGVPTALGFLLIGILAGLPSVGNIAFSDYQFAFRLGIVALVLIIFDGGLNTSMQSFRRVAAPATLLATLGVVITAAVISGAGLLFGMPTGAALLLGAVVSSTDAAAVFSVLRGSGLQLRHRVASTIEVESGLNDPVAVLLTLTITEQLISRERHPIPVLVLDGVLDLIIGAIVGYVIARLALVSFTRVRPASGGLTAVVTTSLALLAFGAATLLHGSG